MTDNNEDAAAKPPVTAAPANTDNCEGCGHKRATAAASPDKRKTPLLPEPPEPPTQTSGAAASPLQPPPLPQQPRQGTKRQHSATVVAAALDPASTITLTVAPFTGGPFSLKMRKADSVEDLKKAVAKKLKVLKDRICLLYRER